MKLAETAGSFVFQNASPPKRRGVVLMIMLVVLLILSLMILGVTRLAVARKKAVAISEERSRVYWLAESGVDRAFAKLSQDPRYTGETWKIPAKELGGSRDAEIVVEASLIDSKPNERSVHVRARFVGDLKSPRAQSTRNVRIHIPLETGANQ